ncbi:MAG: hypothetical protein JJU46_01270 [Balneolaceae bacterium]|nr:hypothetical protein [Balneolaceae bacterium]
MSAKVTKKGWGILLVFGDYVLQVWASEQTCKHRSVAEDLAASLCVAGCVIRVAGFGFFNHNGH